MGGRGVKGGVVPVCLFVPHVSCGDLNTRPGNVLGLTRPQFALNGGKKARRPTSQPAPHEQVREYRTRVSADPSARTMHVRRILAF